jgi:hypothetical protein
MKSSPLSMNACTGAGTPPRARPNTWRQSRLVRSGFCSDPESANSRSITFLVSTNHDQS